MYSRLVSKIMFFSLPKFKDFNRVAVAYSEPSQTSKLQRFVEIVIMILDPTVSQIPRQ